MLDWVELVNVRGLVMVTNSALSQDEGKSSLGP